MSKDLVPAQAPAPTPQVNLGMSLHLWVYPLNAAASSPGMIPLTATRGFQVVTENLTGFEGYFPSGPHGQLFMHCLQKSRSPVTQQL